MSQSLIHIEVASKANLSDPEALQLGEQLRSHGVEVEDVRVASIYLVEGALSEADGQRIASEILVDPVIEQGAVNGSAWADLEANPEWHTVTIYRKPGVMDPVEASAIKAIRDIGIDSSRVRTGKKFLFKGSFDHDALHHLADDYLANEVIEDIFAEPKRLDSIDLGRPYSFELKHVALRDASDDVLMQISRDYTLSLTLEEMHTVQAHFRELDRDPTDLELETVAQTWSEHCKHKTFNSEIVYNGENIGNLIKTTIFQATHDLDRDWCVSVFKDNAGIIRFTDDYDLCFKVETHNHPSAIEPYGGASTGLGGVLRDILGCGMGAKPIMSTDVFCVGQPNMDPEHLPPGTIHPERILRGVVAGVRDYGNRMGIPTVNGGVFVDDRYVGNPLVYAGSVGLIPVGMSEKAAKVGDLIVTMGGRTGRDGIHGATFSSAELTEESEEVSGGAVQIGNAITEKKVLDVVLQARDRGLYNCITDCGAGGFSSAVGEMGEEVGAEVELTSAPLKYDGLTYAEIWISEAQERMVLSVPPEKVDELVALCKSEDVEAAVLGTFTGDRMLRVKYDGELVGEMSMEFLHDGLPDTHREATWSAPELHVPDMTHAASFDSVLKQLLSSWNIASKHWIIRQYDHEVQAGSVAKPLVGRDHDGPGDAAVGRPDPKSPKGVAVGCGMSPTFGDLDPYHMATTAIDEAIRNVVAVGGNPDHTAILDNFSWGNPHRPEILGALVRASQGCKDAAMAFRTPFISGKDSLHNEFRVGEETITIPHTLLISAISVVPDTARTVTMDLKEPGNAIFILGETRDELGGSHYYRIHDEVGEKVPTVNFEVAKATFEKLHIAIQSGLVSACHDLCEGGLAVAIAEMAFAGGVGAEINLAAVAKTAATDLDAEILFSESPSRFLVEVTPEHEEAFRNVMEGIPYAKIGATTKEEELEIFGGEGELVLSTPLDELKEAWLKPLDW